MRVHVAVLVFAVTLSACSSGNGGQRAGSEVSDYIEQLRAKGPVECDDGTAISELGVP